MDMSFGVDDVHRFIGVLVKLLDFLRNFFTYLSLRFGKSLGDLQKAFVSASVS